MTGVGDPIKVERDGEAFEGIVAEVSQVSSGGQSLERLTVRRDDDTLTYVLPDAEGTTVTSTVESRVASMDQPPRTTSAPPIGVSQGGIPFTPAIAPPLPPAPAPTPPPPPEAPRPPTPERFMVQSTGKPSRYHTRADCGKVPANARTRSVDDEDIGFFELEQCAFCAKRDGQMSWQEVMESIVTTDQAEALAKALIAKGFRISPEVVDR